MGRAKKLDFVGEDAFESTDQGSGVDWDDEQASLLYRPGTAIRLAN